jgi:UV DNA damage endonuclease
MFDQTVRRIGFACKYMHPDQSLPSRQLKVLQSRLTECTTTNQWMQRQLPQAAYNRLWEIMQHNTQAAYNLIKYVGSLPAGQRMVRLGSDQLPFYTLDPWRDFYKRSDVRDFCERHYAPVGQLARELDVRVSMHPGQFTVLGSANDDIVDRSILELEYHADIARWMGYGNTFQDFKINVHLSGRRGAQGFRDNYGRLSPELRNMMTVENDEYTSGLADIVELGDLFALVFDTHHHWIHSNEFIDPQRDLFQRVINSWRGVRPVVHYSVSREEYLTEVGDLVLPDREILKAQGYASTKLRAHSNTYSHTASNDMIAEFWPYADIMAESKHKNLASTQLYNYLMASLRA